VLISLFPFDCPDLHRQRAAQARKALDGQHYGHSEDDHQGRHGRTDGSKTLAIL